MGHDRTGESAARRRRLRRAWQVVAAALGATFIAASTPRHHSALTTTVPWDLVVDERLARSVVAGFNPYSDEGMSRSGLAGMGPAGAGHPPTTALWAVPFVRRDLRAAALILGVTVGAALLGSLVLVAATLGAPTPVALAWVVSGYVLFCPFMVYHVGVGQISGLIATLLVVAWWAARRQRDVAAGAALGAACALKLFPGLVVLLFLVVGRFRVVAAAIAVYLGAAGVATARFGFSAWPLFFRRQGPIADMWMDSIQSQSLHGIVLRLFRPACGPQGGPLASSTSISVALSVALVAMAAVWARRAVRDGRFDLAYALFVTLSVLASQWAWEHYNVIHLLPAAIAAAALARGWRVPGGRRLALAGFAVLLALAASWQLDPARRLALQAAVRAQDGSRHLLMHAHEVANWAPPLALMVLLGVLTRPSAGDPADRRRPLP